MIRYAFSETATTTRFLDKNHELGLTNRFIARAEAPLLNAVFPWIFSARPDGFDGRDEQAVQFF